MLKTVPDFTSLYQRYLNRIYPAASKWVFLGCPWVFLGYPLFIVGFEIKDGFAGGQTAMRTWL